MDFGLAHVLSFGKFCHVGSVSPLSWAGYTSYFGQAGYLNCGMNNYLDVVGQADLAMKVDALVGRTRTELSNLDVIFR